MTDKFQQDLAAGKLRKVDWSKMDFNRTNAERLALMKSTGDFDTYNDELYVANSFKDKLREGDEVYAYSDIGNLSGSEGYILVRNGQVVAQQISMRS